MIKNFQTIFFIFSILFLICIPPRIVESSSLDQIKLPPGFQIEIYANNVPNARSMVMSPNGTLFVGTRNHGSVNAVIKKDGQTIIKSIAQGLRSPNGVAFRNGSLYIAEVSRIWRIDNIEEKLETGEKMARQLITRQLPTDGGHGWKYIAFGPDDKLYVPVGAPCNVCERDDMRYASILTMDPDGQNMQLFARGVRNTVGFTWHPESNEMWFTDNGRDMLGDDIPPDELNHAPKAGMHFGFPYCHGGNIRDPQFGHKAPCNQFEPPAQRLGPHVAALGIKFYTGTMFPKEYHNQIFIAEHGSWNRSKKLGYRISLVRLENGEAMSYETFAEGWMKDESVWGRPVDLLVLADGSMLVSDDYASAIYRIFYNGKNLEK